MTPLEHQPHFPQRAHGRHTMTEFLVYRARSQAEMPANNFEYELAKNDVIIFNFLTAPVEIMGKGKVEGIKCIKMKLGEPDESGRRRPIPIPDSEEIIDINTAIIAIGQNPNPLIPQTMKGLKVQKWGNIETDKDGRTNIPGLFAGGDIATGAATVILAMGAGKTAARAMDQYMKTKKWPKRN